MRRPCVLIVESGIRWEAAWRRSELTSAPVHCDNLRAAESHVRQAPASVVLLDATSISPPELVAFLTKRREALSKAFLIVAGGAELEPARWELLECGADVVVGNERQLPSACQAAARHLARWRPPAFTLRERVWESLPWSEVAG